MVSSISRNWVGGLASGLDTQGLLDKIMEAERAPLNALERKRNKISYQQAMLQEINLKLLTLQNKATDLTFSRTFNSKSVTSTNDKIVSAVATTAAKVGSYTLKVKQLATSTSVSSVARLGGAIELGEYLNSTQSIGGANTALSNLGITPGTINLTLGSASASVTVDSNATVQNLISSINNAVAANADMRGKVAASYDQKTNRMKITLLDNTKVLTLADTAGDTVAKMFSASGTLNLTRDVPAADSSLVTIRSGLKSTLHDLGIDPSSAITIQRQGGPVETLDLMSAGLTSDSTLEEMIGALNRQIDSKSSLVKDGVVTGNPSDRLLEFRFDGANNQLMLVNTDSSDAVKFTLGTSSGNLPLQLFGNSTITSSTDAGAKLVNETFASTVSSGSFTIDGVIINIDNQTDTLQSVLSRITSLTDIKATYNSAKDVIELTRKDGSDLPIGLGSANDTSNFLSVTGLIAGVQKSSAVLQSQSPLTFSATDALSKNLEELGLASAGTSGKIRITVNGAVNTINWNSGDTLASVMNRIDAISGVENASYDGSTHTFRIVSEQKGSTASLKLEDIDGGLGVALGISSGMTAVGSDTSSTLTSGRPISSINSAASLDKMGLKTAITPGSFTINGVSFTITSTSSMTLDSLINTINNNAKAGVKAEFNANTGKFTLTSKQTGNTTIALGSPTDTSNFLSAMGLTSAPQEVGQNAVFSIDGINGGSDIVRQSNSVSDVVSGVTFTLKAVTTGSGETIDIKSDVESARKTIDSFIESYNEVMDLLYTKLSEKHDNSLDALSDWERNALSKDDLALYEEKYKVGLLSGDSTLISVRSQMRVTISGVVGNVDKFFDSLSDIGITTGAVGSDYQSTQIGKLIITDEDKLTKALTDNPDKVAELFARDSTSTSGMGIARRLKNVLNEFTKSDGILTKRAGRSGVAFSNSSMDRQISLINSQITRQEERLKDKEESLLKQYSALETAMSKYQSQSEAFSNQLSQLLGTSR